MWDLNPGLSMGNSDNNCFLEYLLWAHINCMLTWHPMLGTEYVLSKCCLFEWRHSDTPTGAKQKRDWGEVAKCIPAAVGSVSHPKGSQFWLIVAMLEFQAWSQLGLTVILWRRYAYPHFTDEKTESQRGEIPCLASVTEPGFEPEQVSPECKVVFQGGVYTDYRLMAWLLHSGS